ncbi:MAG TPA: glycosyltransferase [Pyrinomonadaceae bacterium]
MSEQTEIPDISVVITTYNRADLLAATLQGLFVQETGGVRYEIVVVDNNSTDNTRQVVESFCDRGGPVLRYVFEPRQGVSHGRNAGVTAARASIIAFTDDDVVPTPGWVAQIKRAFDKHKHIDVLGGKILPEWQSPPPRWLTTDHWWPLALLDRGDEPFYVNAANPLCLPTANAAFRREVLSYIGPFSEQFSTREDHELLIRLWQSGRQGLYEPKMVVLAKVQPERMCKSYHRQWNKATGKFNSLMRLGEIMDADGSIGPESRNTLRLYDVPAYMYRELFVESFRWLKQRISGNESTRLQCENRLYYLCGYVSTRYGQTSARKKFSALTELMSFAKAVWRKKVLRQQHS